MLWLEMVKLYSKQWWKSILKRRIIKKTAIERQKQREQKFKQEEKDLTIQKKLDDLNNSNVNPLQIFNLPEISLEQLKIAYRKLALKHIG